SDWLCRLVTGQAVEYRRLYSDGGVYTSVLRRTGVATSINLPHGLGQDAVERLITITFPRISAEDRQSEATLRARYENLRPYLLGAILDDVAGILANSARAGAETQGRLPRMADYAAGLYALDLHRGGDHFDAYVEAVDRAMTDRVGDDP